METIIAALVYITAYDKLPIDKRNHTMRLKYEEALSNIHAASGIKQDISAEDGR